MHTFTRRGLICQSIIVDFIKSACFSWFVDNTLYGQKFWDTVIPCTRSENARKYGVCIASKGVKVRAQVVPHRSHQANLVLDTAHEQ